MVMDASAAAAPAAVPGALAGPVVDGVSALDCSPQGLAAFSSGAAISIVDLASMQLVHTLVAPPPPLDRSGGLAGGAAETAGVVVPVTAARFKPGGLDRDLAHLSSLQLAAGDRAGRVALWEVGGGAGGSAGGGAAGSVDAVEWVMGRPWLLAVLHASCAAVVWDLSSSAAASSSPAAAATATPRVIWRYDGSASPTGELLVSLALDPHDPRRLCVHGARGLVLALQVDLGAPGKGGAGGSGGSGGAGKERGVSIKTTTLQLPLPELAGGGGGPTGAGSQVVACAFAPHTRDLLYAVLPRDIVCFDLHFGCAVASSSLPRSVARLTRLLLPPSSDVLYCLHADGKLSMWQRRPGRQLYMIRTVEPLVPLPGSAAPSPGILAAMLWPQPFREAQLVLQAVPATTPRPNGSLGGGVAAGVSLHGVSSCQVVCVSDDNKLWHWLATTAPVSGGKGAVRGAGDGEKGDGGDGGARGGRGSGGAGGGGGEGGGGEGASAMGDGVEVAMKLELLGMFHGFSSAPTTLSVPAPSLFSCVPGACHATHCTAAPTSCAPPVPTLCTHLSPPRIRLSIDTSCLLLHVCCAPTSPPPLLAPHTSCAGLSTATGSLAAAAVPLVAVATQEGGVELVDTAVHAIAASFLLHPSMVRGVRWLGNTRLVSFSFQEAKAGGYENRVVVTCIRSGESRPFRQLQQPDKSPMRGLRASPSGRYLLILFRDAPAEVWAMTRTPQMLRSLALPFTVMEWALPPVQSPTPLDPHSALQRHMHDDDFPASPTSAALLAATPRSASDPIESFAFALVNGSLGVFELRGKRVRDFRPKWPSASFVAVDVLVTAMAYRTPVVALGDKAGVLRWWDVASGAAGTHALNRGAIRRLRFAPTLVNSSSCGRIAVMFNDYTFALFDLDEGEFVAGAMPSEAAASLQVLEMDWLPLQGPSPTGPSAARQLLCVAAADGTVRLLDIATNAPLKQPLYRPPASRLAVWHRFRPSPLCSVALMPAPCALALRLLLQMGVHPAWLEAPLPPGAQGDGGELGEGQGEGEEEGGEEVGAGGDLLAYVVQRGQLPGGVGDPAMAEVLLKGLHPMRTAGQLMGVEAARAYSKVCGGGVAARCACVAAHYGDIQEAHFWLLLPHALRLLAQASGTACTASHALCLPAASPRLPTVTSQASPVCSSSPFPSFLPSALLLFTSSVSVSSHLSPPLPPSPCPPVPSLSACPILPVQGSAGPHAFWPPDSAAPAADAGSGGSGADGTAGLSAAGAGGEGYGEEAVGEEVEVWGDEMGVRRMAQERIHWHSQVTGADAASKRVHEFIMVGDLEAAVTLLLATPFDSPAFHRDALRAVALATAVSPSMHHLAAKVVATNMVLAGEPLTAVHLLCSIAQYADACTQLQAIGRWVDASTLAACHLSGADRAKVLHRWAQHTLKNEHDLWRAVTLFVAAGSLTAALRALREAHQPDTAMMLLLACHHAHARLAPPSRRLSATTTAPVAIGRHLPAVPAGEGDVGGKQGVGGEGGMEGREGERGGEEREGREGGEGWKGEEGEEGVDGPLWLPGDLRTHGEEEVQVVCGLFSQHQRWLAHLCAPHGSD
ncbi:unnamed protein product [Closterium sp. Naga37s-1]|nr:unnamed protein product [Closterium sp. Naga37s-1]